MDEDKAVVKIGGGFTVNLGQYESARIDAGVEIQGKKSELPELWKQAEKEVEEQLAGQIEGLKKMYDEKNTLLGLRKEPKFK